MRDRAGTWPWVAVIVFDVWLVRTSRCSLSSAARHAWRSHPIITTGAIAFVVAHWWRPDRWAHLDPLSNCGSVIGRKPCAPSTLF